jgi:hypothetical protein
MKRKGLGKGLGKGYLNIAPMDSHIHSLSAKGVKTYPVEYGKKNISLKLDVDEIKVASSSILQAREFMKQQELIFPAKDKKKIKEREEYRKEQEDLLNKILDEAEVTYKGKPIPKYKLSAKGRVNPVTQKNLVNYIMEFEGGNPTNKEVLNLFGYLIKSGQVWSLQGMYGRQALRFMNSGVISAKGVVNWKKVEELGVNPAGFYYGDELDAKGVKTY